MDSETINKAIILPGKINIVFHVDSVAYTCIMVPLFYNPLLEHIPSPDGIPLWGYRLFSSMLDCVSRAHEIEIRPSSVCGINYL